MIVFCAIPMALFGPIRPRLALSSLRSLPLATPCTRSISSPLSATSTVPVPTLFESSSSTAAASGAPEPFVTPAKNQLFSLEKRRTDSLFRLPEPSLLSEERPAATAAKAITAPPVAASTLPTTGDMLPPARKSGHPRDVFMLAFGGSVHRVTVPPSAQLPLVTLLRHTIVDSASAAFEYHSPSAAHTSGGAGTWAAVELPAAVAASSKGRVRLLDATDEHVFAMTADGLLYRWPMSLKGSFGGARALPRPVARESGGSDAMRFQSLSCGATMALAVTATARCIASAAKPTACQRCRRSSRARSMAPTTPISWRRGPTTPTSARPAAARRVCRLAAARGARVAANVDSRRQGGVRRGASAAADDGRLGVRVWRRQVAAGSASATSARVAWRDVWCRWRRAAASTLPSARTTRRRWSTTDGC
jgi:hypothetical protein